MTRTQPEDCLFEYVILLDGKEIAMFYSDAPPPDVGTLFSPWEFVPLETREEEGWQYQGSFRIIEVHRRPKNVDGNRERISGQSLVHITVQK